jgi:hypothetical protein
MHKTHSLLPDSEPEEVSEEAMEFAPEKLERIPCFRLQCVHPAGQVGCGGAPAGWHL